MTAIDQTSMTQRERAGADRTVALTARRNIAQPRAQAQIGHIGRQTGTSCHEGDVVMLLRRIARNVREHPRPVRRANRRIVYADQRDRVSLARRDETVRLGEYVEWTRDVERLHLRKNRDGDATHKVLLLCRPELAL